MILCAPKDFKCKYMKHCYLKVFESQIGYEIFLKGRGSQVLNPNFSHCEKEKLEAQRIMVKSSKKSWSPL